MSQSQGWAASPDLASPRGWQSAPLTHRDLYFQGGRPAGGRQLWEPESRIRNLRFLKAPVLGTPTGE